MIRDCLNCKKEFYVRPCRKGIAKYCSNRCRGLGQLGTTPYNKGIPRTDKEKKNISNGRKGKGIGNKNSLGFKQSKETIEKRKMALGVGENHHSWKGGLSRNPYPSEFNSHLKIKIRTRDNFKCCLCGRTEREELEELNRVLCVNHIDFDKNNCNENNLNTLCVRCNIKINKNRQFWTDYFNQLYEQ